MKIVRLTIIILLFVSCASKNFVVYAQFPTTQKKSVYNSPSFESKKINQMEFELWLKNKKLEENLVKEEFDFLKEYFSKSINERIIAMDNLYGDILQISVNDIAGLFFTMISDSCMDYNYIGKTIRNRMCYERYVALLKMDSLKSQKPQKMDFSISYSIGNNNLSSLRKIMNMYLSCTLFNRILFIEKYHYYLNVIFINLLQIDIDSLLDVQTENIIADDKFDRKAFEKVKEQWLRKFE